MQWNLEQIRLFVSVAEQRSFSAVARDLRRAQSAVSNAIALLEADLGVSLFERSSGRQPRLTEAGSALLEEAREVLRQCERLDGRAMALLRGEEARLRLAHDEAMPYLPVLDSLEALAERYPGVEVQLASAAQGDVARKLLERRADLGLLFHHEQMPEALERCWAASKWSPFARWGIRWRAAPAWAASNWRAIDRSLRSKAATPAVSS